VELQLLKFLSDGDEIMAKRVVLYLSSTIHKSLPAATAVVMLYYSIGMLLPLKVRLVVLSGLVVFGF
jgi:hypothetical protein